MPRRSTLHRLDTAGTPAIAAGGGWDRAGRAIGLGALGVVVALLLAMAALAAVAVGVAVAALALATRGQIRRPTARAKGPALLEGRRSGDGWVVEAANGSSQ
ncbi:MAG: hypothetical protein ACOYKM_08150 [Caulobacterales bacterium]